MKKTFTDIVLLLIHVLVRSLGGWDVFLRMILGLMFIDFATGSFQIKLDGWDKDKFILGGIKKCMYLFTVAGLVLIEPVLNVEYLREVACLYWGIYEFKSILTTGERFGIKPFKALNMFLDKMLEKISVFK